MNENEVIEWQIAFKKTYKGVPKDVDTACDIAIKALEEIQQYRAIGTVEECRDARERQREKKPIKIENNGFRYTDSYICPNCEKGFTGTGIADFCYHCGQSIDWSDAD